MAILVEQTLLVTPELGMLRFIASEDALVALYFADHRRTPRTYETRELGGNDRHDVIALACEQLREYARGERTVFALDTAPVGTAFQNDVWTALRSIPFGETRSYGQIAQQIGRPRAVRAVGAANGQNPISIIVPCHRVIGKDGTLTGYAGGVERKALLLSLESLAGAGFDPRTASPSSRRRDEKADPERSATLALFQV